MKAITIHTAKKIISLLHFIRLIIHEHLWFRFSPINQILGLYILTDDFNRVYGRVQGKKKSALCRQSRYALLHAIAFALDHARKRKFASGWSDVRQETDITSARTDDVTHGSSYAGNKNAVRRKEKYNGNAMGTIEWLREREREKWSALLSGVATIGGGGVPVAAMQSHSRSLAWENRKRTPSWTPLAFLHLLFFHHLRPALSLSIPFSLFHLLHHPTLVSCCCYALSFRPMVWNPKFRRDLQFEEAY